MVGKTAKRQRHADDDEAATTKGSSSQAPAEKRLPAEERSSPGKENTPLNSQDRGADKKEEGAGQLDLDKYGFCLEDGHRYVDGTTPKDFPPADPDFDMRNESLGVFSGEKPTGLEFFGRYVLLRGRGENGKLYSKPTLFLIKEEEGGGGGEGKHEMFSLPDDLCFGLQYFTETVRQQIMGLVWRKSKRI